VIRLVCRTAQGCDPRSRAPLLAVLFAASPAAAAPEPGPWTSGPAAAPGARAVVRFNVDPGTGLIQPTVRYRLGRCGALRGVSERVSLGLVAATGRHFELASRHRLPGRRAQVRLRFAGRFDSSFEAHGVVRVRIALRGRRGCRIPALSWIAESGGPPSIDDDEALGGELEEDDCEDCEEIPADEDEGDEEPTEDDSEPGEEP
jgi:hypothetical protein